MESALGRQIPRADWQLSFENADLSSHMADTMQQVTHLRASRGRRSPAAGSRKADGIQRWSSRPYAQGARIQGTASRDAMRRINDVRGPPA